MKIFQEYPNEKTDHYPYFARFNSKCFSYRNSPCVWHRLWLFGFIISYNPKKKTIQWTPSYAYNHLFITCFIFYIAKSNQYNELDRKMKTSNHDALVQKNKISSCLNNILYTSWFDVSISSDPLKWERIFDAEWWTKITVCL